MAVAQHLPRGRHQAGDRHLKFHQDRDNLLAEGAADLDAYGRGKNAMVQEILAAAGLTDAERESIN